MEVTSKNFATCSPEVLSAIDSADFISIDCEFTGLRNGVETTAYDTPAEYYTKLRDGSLSFLLVQVGICTYRYDQAKNKYVYKAFNFYVFPRSINRINNDVNFLCQASSISFLSNAGFDFNKLIKEGIPYLTLADEETLLNELNQKYQNINDTESYPKVAIPDDLTGIVNDICNKIEDFLSPENKEKELQIDKCNGFVRKLVFQTAYEKFSTKNFSLTTKWVDNSAYLVAQKGKSKIEQDKENFEKDLNELKDAFGFSKIIKYISDRKKLIVGHNMVLDICHIINRFCLPLPPSYTEFKEIVHQLFPKVIDTKYMCSTSPFKDLIPSSVMDHMMKQLREPPFKLADIEPESSEFGYSETESKAHEAGYDAYMTGLAFITLTAHLGKKAKQNLVKCDSDLLKPYENRLFLMRIMDYSYMNLKGAEPVPKRNHVYHITFPKEWKTSDIMQLFSPYGNIHVSYCNQTTAWVTLLNAEKSDQATSGLTESTASPISTVRKPFSVLTWSTFEKNKRTNAKISAPSKVATSRGQNNVQKVVHEASSTVEKKRTSDIDDIPRKKKKKENSVITQDSRSIKNRKKMVKDQDPSKQEHVRENSVLSSVCEFRTFVFFVAVLIFLATNYLLG
ncbi:poly(A)-specific ribonuclease PARN-like isoform X2 [Planococcus citri]|uniref:poly(A)-specific ribonuclease PARN-like isoform X2 n=1 Tax=Planococcus citri TaxID=170843 RepID=UPI0031F93AC6